MGFNLPLSGAIGNGGARFDRLKSAETLEDIFQEITGAEAPRSHRDWLVLRHELQAEIQDGMSADRATHIFPPLVITLLALRDLKGSLKWLGEYQEALSLFGQGYLIWYGLPLIIWALSYVMDHIDQYPPAETNAGYLKWFLATTGEFLEERKRSRRQPSLPFSAPPWVGPGEEEELLMLACRSLVFLLKGDVSGCQEALAAAYAFDRATNTAFHLGDWVEKRATAAYVKRFVKATIADRFRGLFKL